jgi:hypothetical protein
MMRADDPFPVLTREAVQARMEHARRNGYAGWLWPDVALEDWRAAVEEIARITRDVLRGEAHAVLRDCDPLTASVAGYTSGMGALLGYWVDTGAVRTSAALAEVFRLHLSHNRARMTMLAATAQDIVQRLDRAGAAPVVVKGMHTAFAYFSDPAARTLSDVDLYVPMESMGAAEEMFASAGYRRIPRLRAPYACDWVPAGRRTEPRTLAYVHQDDPWFFDVQGSLNRRLLTGRQVKLDALFAQSRTSPWTLSPCGRVLQQPLLAIHLAAHISQILLSATLQRVVELILVIRKDEASGALDWDDFLAGAEKIGGGRLIYPALVFCEQLAPGTVPARILEACRADAPRNLRQVVGSLSVGAAQPLGRHSFRERFMWAGTWRERLQQVAGELALDGRRQPLPTTLRSVGTKLWALRRGRYTA